RGEPAAITISDGGLTHASSTIPLTVVSFEAPRTAYATQLPLRREQSTASVPGNTMPRNVAVARFTRVPSPSQYAPTIWTSARLQIPLPCTIGRGSPAAVAARRSVWMGFQMLAHSLYT